MLRPTAINVTPIKGRVKTDGFTVCWPDEQDLCPDDLYELSSAVKQEALS